MYFYPENANGQQESSEAHQYVEGNQEDKVLFGSNQSQGIYQESHHIYQTPQNRSSKAENSQQHYPQHVVVLGQNPYQTSNPYYPNSSQSARASYQPQPHHHYINYSESSYKSPLTNNSQYGTELQFSISPVEISGYDRLEQVSSQIQSIMSDISKLNKIFNQHHQVLTSKEGNRGVVIPENTWKSMKNVTSGAQDQLQKFSVEVNSILKEVWDDKQKLMTKKKEVDYAAKVIHDKSKKDKQKISVQRAKLHESRIQFDQTKKEFAKTVSDVGAIFEAGTGNMKKVIGDFQDKMEHHYHDEWTAWIESLKDDAERNTKQFEKQVLQEHALTCSGRINFARYNQEESSQQFDQQNFAQRRNQSSRQRNQPQILQLNNQLENRQGLKQQQIRANFGSRMQQKRNRSFISDGIPSHSRVISRNNKLQHQDNSYGVSNHQQSYQEEIERQKYYVEEEGKKEEDKDKLVVPEIQQSGSYLDVNSQELYSKAFKGIQKQPEWVKTLDNASSQYIVDQQEQNRKIQKLRDQKFNHLPDVDTCIPVLYKQLEDLGVSKNLKQEAQEEEQKQSQIQEEVNSIEQTPPYQNLPFRRKSLSSSRKVQQKKIDHENIERSDEVRIQSKLGQSRSQMETPTPSRNYMLKMEVRQSVDSQNLPQRGNTNNKNILQGNQIQQIDNMQNFMDWVSQDDMFKSLKTVSFKSLYSEMKHIPLNQGVQINKAFQERIERQNRQRAERSQTPDNDSAIMTIHNESISKQSQRDQQLIQSVEISIPQNNRSNITSQNQSVNISRKCSEKSLECKNRSQSSAKQSDPSTLNNSQFYALQPQQIILTHHQQTQSGSNLPNNNPVSLKFIQNNPHQRIQYASRQPSVEISTQQQLQYAHGPHISITDSYVSQESSSGNNNNNNNNFGNYLVVKRYPMGKRYKQQSDSIESQNSNSISSNSVAINIVNGGNQYSQRNNKHGSISLNQVDEEQDQKESKNRRQQIGMNNNQQNFGPNINFHHPKISIGEVSSSSQEASSSQQFNFPNIARDNEELISESSPQQHLQNQNNSGGVQINSPNEQRIPLNPTTTPTHQSNQKIQEFDPSSIQAPVPNETPLEVIQQNQSQFSNSQSIIDSASRHQMKVRGGRGKQSGIPLSARSKGQQLRQKQQIKLHPAQNHTALSSRCQSQFSQLTESVVIENEDVRRSYPRVSKGEIRNKKVRNQKLQRHSSTLIENNSNMYTDRKVPDLEEDDLHQQSVMSYEISQGDSLNVSKSNKFEDYEQEEKVIIKRNFKSPDELQINIQESKYGGGKNRRNEFHLRKSIPYKSNNNIRPNRNEIQASQNKPIEIMPQLPNHLNIKLPGSESASNNRQNENKLLISTSSQQNSAAILNTQRQLNHKPPPRKIFKRSVLNGKMMIDKSAIAKKIENFKQLTSSSNFKVAGNNRGGKFKLNLNPNIKQRQQQISSQSFTHQNSNSFASEQPHYRLNVSSTQNSESNPDTKNVGRLYYPKADIPTTNSTGVFGQLQDEAGFYSPSIVLNMNKNNNTKKSDNFSESASNKYSHYYHQEPSRQLQNSRNIFSSQNNSSMNYQVGGGGMQPIITASNHKNTTQVSRLGSRLFKNMVFNVVDYKNNTYHQDQQQQSRLIAVAKKPLYNNTTLLDDVNEGPQIYGSKVLDALTLDFNPKSQTMFHCTATSNGNHKLSDLVNNQEQKLSDYQLNYQNNCNNDFYHHERQGGGAFDINMYQSGVCFLTGEQSIAHFGEYEIMMMMNKNQKNANSSCYTGRQHGRIIKLNSGLFITQRAIDINSLKNSTNVPDMRSRGFFFGQQQQHQLPQQLPQSQFKFNSCRLSQKVLQNQATSGANKNLKIATIKNSNSISNKSGTQKSTTQKFSKFMKGGQQLMGKKFSSQNNASEIGDRRTQKWN